jgi:predicted Fe-S protein YdhL (DUF1289 family)
MMMIKSPCILVCKLENDVCIGCKRTKEEITMWTKYTDEEKQNVLMKLIVNKHNEINHLFETGQDIPQELTENFVTFPLKKVVITRLTVRQKRKYSVPAKYSSYTQYELFIDDKSVYEFVLHERFKTLKQFVEWAKKKYDFTEYKLLKMGSHNI